uniref:TAR DNA-binding protein 43 N-terminal domain-containing protein n=1 Tax=Meloidogyne incognita TaxID=6306 RepID=A0A914NJ74_MELIC
MADNIANILPLSSIKLGVETVEVELEQNDGSLLLSTIQSAFPNSIGIYYRPKGKECRTMLKFDGRRFMPPSGGWKSGIEYFVEMGGVSRHSTFPFGSYESASKQFERSVNLVQKMMNGCSIKANGQKYANNDISRLSEDDSAYFENRNNITNEEMGVISPLSKTVQIFNESDYLDGQRQNNFESTKKINSEQKSRKNSETLNESKANTSRELKSLEKDFADLARICTGKDSIIDGQRMELEETKNELERIKLEGNKWKEELLEWDSKWATAQQELEIMRKLGKDQEFLQGQITEMSVQIDNERESWEKIKGELELQLKKWQKDAQDWREKSELSTWAVQELTEQLKKLQREKTDLQRKTTILEEQVNGEAIEFNRRFKERERIQNELLTDNTRLYQINDQLENKFKELKEENEKLNEKLLINEKENDKKLEEIKIEFNEKENKFNEFLNEKEAKIEEMEGKINELTKQKLDLQAKLQQLTNHSQVTEGGNDPLFAYTQD